MKKIINLFRKNTLEKVYVQESHKIQNGELVNTGFSCGYVRF